MEISFNGFENNLITFKADSSVSAGSLVYISENATVSKCENGDSFIGIAVAVKNGYAAVQTKGHTQVKTGDDIPLGRNSLASDGNDCVIAGTDTYTFLVISTDSENHVADIIL